MRGFLDCPVLTAERHVSSSRGAWRVPIGDNGHAVVREVLHLAPEYTVVCGMSPVFVNEGATANRLQTGRQRARARRRLHDLSFGSRPRQQRT